MAWMRRSGKIDEAIRYGDRMVAFAQFIAARCPRESASHVLLSEAFTQVAKNAWQSDDRAAIERNWKLALGCAHQALDIDPRDVHAAAQAADIALRLDRFQAD
jgi:hypothetical protein